MSRSRKAKSAKSQANAHAKPGNDPQVSPSLDALVDQLLTRAEQPASVRGGQAAREPVSTESDTGLQGEALVKETCRRIRVARSYWDAHNNRACRKERDRALELYNQLTKAQKQQIPETLKVWLRYRSEKYFGDHRTPPGGQHGRSPAGKSAPPANPTQKSGKSRQSNQAHPLLPPPSTRQKLRWEDLR